MERNGRRRKMSDFIEGIKRENLVEEISAALHQWPELEQRIFSQAHYYGQSPETISHSLQLDLQQVSAILKECDRRLYAFLRNGGKNSSEKPSLIPNEIQVPLSHRTSCSAMAF
jgi:hypothetical protein